MPGKKILDYDPIPFQKLLQQLLEESGESYRKASTAAGLHPATVSNYMHGMRPGRDACIALADHFGIHPNVMLEAAGYKPLHFFDRVDLGEVTPRTKRIADTLEQIADGKAREHLYEVIQVLLDAHLVLEGKGQVLGPLPDERVDTRTDDDLRLKLLRGIRSLELSTRVENALTKGLGYHAKTEVLSQRSGTVNLLGFTDSDGLMSFDEWIDAILNDSRRREWILFVKGLGEKGLAELIEALKRYRGQPSGS